MALARQEWKTPQNIPSKPRQHPLSPMNNWIIAARGGRPFVEGAGSSSGNGLQFSKGCQETGIQGGCYEGLGLTWSDGWSTREDALPDSTIGDSIIGDTHPDKLYCQVIYPFRPIRPFDPGPLMSWEIKKHLSQRCVDGWLFRCLFDSPSVCQINIDQIQGSYVSMFVLFVQQRLICCLFVCCEVWQWWPLMSDYLCIIQRSTAAATEFSKTIGHLWPMPGFKFEKLC